MLLVQISDLHVMAEGRLAVDRIDTADYLAQAIDRILALPETPDAVLVTGDLGDEILPEEIARAADLLARIQSPVFIVPGNHDNRDLIRAHFPKATYLPREGKLDYVVETRPLRLVALDTVVPGRVHGEVDEAQIDWLDRVLSAEPNVPTVVFMHHPPFLTGLPVMDGWTCQRGEEIEAVIARHPQVERVLAGHVHRHVSARFGGTLAMTAPALCHAIAIGPPDDRGFPMYTLETPGLLIHKWDGARLVTQLVQTAGDWQSRRF